LFDFSFSVNPYNGYQFVGYQPNGDAVFFLVLQTSSLGTALQNCCNNFIQVIDSQPKVNVYDSNNVLIYSAYPAVAQYGTFSWNGNFCTVAGTVGCPVLWIPANSPITYATNQFAVPAQYAVQGNKWEIIWPGATAIGYFFTPPTCSTGDSCCGYDVTHTIPGVTSTGVFQPSGNQ
jgi:hypothetical protein